MNCDMLFSIDNRAMPLTRPLFARCTGSGSERVVELDAPPKRAEQRSSWYTTRAGALEGEVEKHAPAVRTVGSAAMKESTIVGGVGG